MSDVTHVENQTAPQVTAPEAPAAPVAEQPANQPPQETEETEFVASSERRFYTPQQGNEAQSFLATIPRHRYYVITYEGTPEAPWPDGAGCAVLPIAKREPGADGVNVNRLYGFIAWPYFALQELVGVLPEGMTDEAKKYLSSMVENDQATRILNPLRKQEIEKAIGPDGKVKLDLTGLPRTVKEHLEGVQTSHGMLKGYNEVAKDYLAALKKSNALFKNFTVQMLRQFMSSSAMARSFNAQVEEIGYWSQLIDKMEATAKERGLPTEIFEQWRNTRDEGDEIDLSSLSIDDLSIS